MGYNSTIVVMNDALHDIEKDPDFGKSLSNAISMHDRPEKHYQDVRAGCHCNAATVIECKHADVTSVIAVGGNYGSVIGSTYGYSHHKEEDKIKILKEIANQLGYTLHKKRNQ